MGSVELEVVDVTELQECSVSGQLLEPECNVLDVPHFVVLFAYLQNKNRSRIRDSNQHSEMQKFLGPSI